VKFLVDENLSPRVADLLTDAGHEAVHVRDLEAAGASDADVMALAATERRIIVSADTDFGALLAQANSSEPSVLLVREVADLRPSRLVDVILRYLDVLEPHLKAGAIAAFTATGVRVRALPIR
jgi:predicted nuclease of predicted toxin-antitoxin system